MRRLVERLRRLRRSLGHWWPLIWRPVLVAAGGLAGAVLFSYFPAPVESSAFSTVADPLRAGGIPEAVISSIGCVDEDHPEIEYALGCTMLAVDASGSTPLRIAMGKVSNIAGYWSGSDAILVVAGLRVSATSRSATWGSELPGSHGKSVVWIDAPVPAPGPGGFVGTAEVEVRYPKSSASSDVGVAGGFVNTRTRLSRELEFYGADAAELQALATLAEIRRDSYPGWQRALQYTFGAVLLFGLGWWFAAWWRGRRRPRRPAYGR